MFSCHESLKIPSLSLRKWKSSHCSSIGNIKRPVVNKNHWCVISQTYSSLLYLTDFFEKVVLTLDGKTFGKNVKRKGVTRILWLNSNRWSFYKILRKVIPHFFLAMSSQLNCKINSDVCWIVKFHTKFPKMVELF